MIERRTFDSFHRAHHICLLNGRAPVVNFRVRIVGGTSFDLNIRLAFALYVLSQQSFKRFAMY